MFMINGNVSKSDVVKEAFLVVNISNEVFGTPDIFNLLLVLTHNSMQLSHFEGRIYQGRRGLPYFLE